MPLEDLLTLLLARLDLLLSIMEEVCGDPEVATSPHGSPKHSQDEEKAYSRENEESSTRVPGTLCQLGRGCTDPYP